MLRQEEPAEQRVDPQQPIARQRHDVGSRRSQIAIRRQRIELRTEAIQHVHAVLVAER